MMDFFNYSFHGLSVLSILIVLGFVVLGIIADKFSLWLINYLLQRHEKKKSELALAESADSEDEEESKPKRSFFGMHVASNIPKIMEALQKPLHVFFITVGCSLGVAFIDVPDWAKDFSIGIRKALEAISLWCLIWFLLNLIQTVITPIAIDRAKKSGTHVGEILIPILISILRIMLIVIGILFVAQCMDYPITTFLTGLGLGGAAIALASKDTISNIFGSFVIIFDHPFEIGDWVTINGIQGTVEDISLRSVKIRTFDDTQVSIPNQMLTTTQIDRRGKVKTKLDCSFGVLYSTTEEQLRSIIKQIEEYIESHDEMFVTEKHYVHFNEFGDSSLNVTVVAYTKDTKYKQHVKYKEEFMFAIMRIVRESGTEFAFPTRTLEFPATPINIKMGE